jgi:hypothetical protein
MLDAQDPARTEDDHNRRYAAGSPHTTDRLIPCALFAPYPDMIYGICKYPGEIGYTNCINPGYWTPVLLAGIGLLSNARPLLGPNYITFSQDLSISD